MAKRKADADGLYKRADSPYWWASYTDSSGKRTRRSTGVSGRKEAEAILSKWKLATHQERTWGVAPSRTLEEVMLAYLQEFEAMGKRSLPTYKFHARQLLASFAGHGVETLRPSDISAHINRRRADGVRPATINRELEVLSAAINHVNHRLEWGLPNPVTGRMLREPDGRVRWLTPEEADRLVVAARGVRAPYLADLIEIALHTGLRREELLGLEWCRVDLAADVIRLEGRHTKAGKPRTVPINHTARRALLSRASYRASTAPDTPWVFADRHGDRVVDPRKGFLSACRGAGISDFRFHDLRHTCASWLVQRGTTLQVVAEILGHSTAAMANRYAHLAPHQAREALVGLDARESRSGHAGAAKSRKK